MLRTCRALLIGIGSLIAFVALTSSAHALTATPTSLTGLAGSTTLRANPIGGGSIDATCGASSISGTVANTAAGVVTAPTSIPVGSAFFTSCTLSGVNLTVTQTSAWNGTVTVLAGTGSTITGVQLRVAIPRGGVSLTSASGCNFTVSGSRTILTTSLTTLGAGTALITTSPATAANLTLVVDSTNQSLACAAAKIGVGVTGTFLGTYSLNAGSGLLLAL